LPRSIEPLRHRQKIPDLAARRRRTIFLACTLSAEVFSACGGLCSERFAMKDMFVALLIVAAILLVCGLYFKAVILNWLARDAELRALNDTPEAERLTSSH
jgi:hypothetical protein